MKVNKNAATFIADLHQNGAAASGSNIPIRLEIASRIIAGIVGVDGLYKQGFGGICFKNVSMRALDLADALIEAHNSTREEVGLE